MGDGGTILASTDGGATWRSRSSATGNPLRDVACPTSRVCIAVGGFHNLGTGDTGSTILVSADGGATWRSRSSGSSNALFGITCPTRRACLAVGDSGTILAGEDGAAG